MRELLLIALALLTLLVLGLNLLQRRLRRRFIADLKCLASSAPQKLNNNPITVNFSKKPRNFQALAPQEGTSDFKSVVRSARKQKSNISTLLGSLNIHAKKQDIKTLSTGQGQPEESFLSFSLSNPKKEYEIIKDSELKEFAQRREELQIYRKNRKRLNFSSSKTQAPAPVHTLHFSRKSIEQAIEDYYVKGDKLKSDASVPLVEEKDCSQSAVPVIDTEEIKNNLLKLRSTRRTESNSQGKNQENAIEVEEVYRNLKGSDSPLTRSKKTTSPVRATIVPDSIIPKEAKNQRKLLKQQNTNGGEQEPLLSRFTPSDNSLGSSTNKVLDTPPSPASTGGSQSQLYARKRQNYPLSNKNNEENTSKPLHKGWKAEFSPSAEHNNPVSEVTSIVSASNSSVPTSTEENFLLPPLNLLEAQNKEEVTSATNELIASNGQLIENKLAEFKVKVKVTDAYSGPVITRYDIEPDTGVRGNQVLNLEKDLARALGCGSVRIVDTIPGKTCMGLELPNPKRKIIRLSELLNNETFLKSRSQLTLALGQDI
ncbi:MAG: DNA translocase FtsK, partial [Neisseriaceae bacterium]